MLQIGDHDNELIKKEIAEMEGLKLLRDYLRDQLKFDVDFIRNTVADEDKGGIGSPNKLAAFRRGKEVADP